MIADETWRRVVVSAQLHAAGAQSLRECLDLVDGVLDERAAVALRKEFADVEPAPGPRADEHMPAALRRAAGAYFTPAVLAHDLARLCVEPVTTGLVLDISCGDGALLAACQERADVRAVGIERELVFALAAAVRLRERPARVVWGDGLELRDELRGAVAVIGNPPYVGEKGNRALFVQVREAFGDLEPYFGPRIDLHYLFLHRALDYLAPGGRLGFLTSEYWLTATGAARLRADLSARAESFAFEELGAGAFASAPGQHSLLFGATRRAVDGPGEERTWHPFAKTARATEGLRLGDIAVDRQGFVSGADRTTARTARLLGVEADLPIFVWHADEVPDEDRDLFRPLVRRSDCEPNVVFREPPGHDFVLWCDGGEDATTQSRIEARLAPFRELLAARREAKRGLMGWSRIWWPRNTAEYARPKLVVPRRAKRSRFCLDLSGSHVSSDCTFLLAPPGSDDEVAWLVRVMLAANSPGAVEQLRAFGKTKGDIMEFYSAPLTDWRLPLRRSGAGLRLEEPALEGEATNLLTAIRQSLK